MKKLLSIIFLGLLLCNFAFAEYYTKEDQEYIANMKKAEVAKQTVEEAYKFGLGIQKAVEDKDMKKLLSYVGDKLDLSYFQNKSFDEVFTEEFRTRILSDETGGQRVGWRGWMLGDGAVWYDGYRDSFSITAFNFTKATSSEETPAAWKIDNKYLTPNCFVYMWMSGDNYEEFFDTYIENVPNTWNDPRFHDFYINIGTYLNKEVPLNHTIKTGWPGNPEMSLTKQLEGCLSDKPETYIKRTTKYGGGEFVEKYEVIKSFDLKIGKELAPHINKNFESIKQVTLTQDGGGSIGAQRHSTIYGVLELNGEKVILPLKNLKRNY